MLLPDQTPVISGAHTFDPIRASEEVWEALLSAGVFVTTTEEFPYVFASGPHATAKADAEILQRRPKQRAIIIGHMATMPCLQKADVLTYVPTGMELPTYELGEILGKPVARVERLPNAQTRYDFMFSTVAARQLALSAGKLCICEDVMTTGGSVDGVVNLVRPDLQNVQAAAYLLRGAIKPEYAKRIQYHALVERAISTDAQGFLASLEPWERVLYQKAAEL